VPHRPTVESAPQIAMLAADLEPMYAAAAKERQGTRTDLCADLRTSGGKHRAVDDAAKAMGVSSRLVQDTRHVNPGLSQGTRTDSQTAYHAAAGVQGRPGPSVDFLAENVLSRAPHAPQPAENARGAVSNPRSPRRRGPGPSGLDNC